MELYTTPRGFRRADFTDLYGAACSIQESSLVEPPALWLGRDAGTHLQGDCLARMHLTQAQAAELIGLLQHFVDTGELPETAPMSTDIPARA